MLKRIALGGFFLLASAFTMSTAVSAPVKARSTTTSVPAPKAPVPQGMCPFVRC
jgi:hypothetical protein